MLTCLLAQHIYIDIGIYTYTYIHTSC
uniref:Uncharacterized protein MANES_03G010000 n=1 Tax=Rhizophora mucronata TaxID=61149 RepID=A0A2P2KME5_RHIMU